MITDLTIVEYPSLLLGHSFRGSIIPFIVIGNLKSSIYLLSLSWESELQQYQHLISLQAHVSDPFVQVRFTLRQQAGRLNLDSISYVHLPINTFTNFLGVFIFFGLSGIAPATHFGIVNGWERSVEEACLGWLILMGILYITGALLYAMRIPERFFPGKLDIWVSVVGAKYNANA